MKGGHLRRNWPLALALLVLAAGCHQDMWVQPKSKAQSREDLVFANASGSRPAIPGTVAYGRDRVETEFYTGYDRSGRLVKEFPVPVDVALLKRGQERFRVFCTPCHGELGNGQGFIAKRGFAQARPVGNYHSDRLRNMPVGHFFDVVTNGHGTMFPFRSRIKPLDRWAIVSYVRVLQSAMHTPVSDVPPEHRDELEKLPHSPDQDEAPELPVGAPPDRRLNVPGGAVRPRFDAPSDRGSRTGQPGGAPEPGGGQ